MLVWLLLGFRALGFVFIKGDFYYRDVPFLISLTEIQNWLLVENKGVLGCWDLGFLGFRV